MDTITLAMAKAFTRREIKDAGISGGGSGGEVNLTPEQIEEILEAVKLKHTHENQSILDQITAEVLREEVPFVHILPETAKEGDLCLYAPTNTITVTDRKIYFDWEEFRKPYTSNNEEYSEAFCNYYGENTIDGSGYNIGIGRGPEYCVFSIESGGSDWVYNCYINFINGELIAEDSWEYSHNFENLEGTERRFTNIEELPQYIELPQVEQVQTDNQNYDNVFLFYTEYKLMKYQRGEWIEVEQSQITEEWLNNLSENTRLRHTHSNLDLLETIVPEMLENRIPTVYSLPENAKDSDLCLYAPKNTITLEDSGKQIYFDWDKIKHYSANDNLIIYSFYLEGTEVGKIKINGKNRQYVFYRTIYIENGVEDGVYTNFLEVVFRSNGTFNSGFQGMIWPDGGVTGKNIESINNLPLYWNVPIFDQIIAETPITTDAYLFHTDYVLMKYQGGEWVEACASESGVTDEQIKNAVDEYLAENPISGITITDDGNGNVIIA